MPPEISAIATLGWVARAKAMASKSYGSDVEGWLAANNAPAAAQRIFKAALGAGSTADSDLGDYGISIGAWSDALRTRSVFYRLLADGAFTRVPIRTRVGIVTVTATGAVVGEGEASPVSRVTLNNLVLEAMKATALIVATNELLTNVSPAGQQLFNRELAGAVSDAVDGALIELITDTGTPSAPASGGSAVDAKSDLRTALLAVNTVGSARLYIVCAPDVATKASTLVTADGADAFPAMSPMGGEMANLPAIVSSGVPAGSLYVIDASGIAADGGPVSVDVSTQADIEMSTTAAHDSTTPTPAQMVSMFQTNSTALRATAWFGAQKLRDDAVTAVTGIAWGA